MAKLVPSSYPICGYQIYEALRCVKLGYSLRGAKNARSEEKGRKIFFFSPSNRISLKKILATKFYFFTLSPPTPHILQVRAGKQGRVFC